MHAPTPKADGPTRVRPLRSAFFVSLLVLLLGTLGWSTPPEYASFGRPQRSDYFPKEEDLLRIWVVFVEQGDGLFVQLPSKYNYTLPGAAGPSERVEILIDGGANPQSEANRIRDFLYALHDGTLPRIEHTVITHHDADHVVGLTELLSHEDAHFEVIHHNGLASYRRGKRGFPASGAPSKPGVYELKNGSISRAMAYLDSSGALDSSQLIHDLGALRQAFNADELQGVYEELAAGLLDAHTHNRLAAFQRVKAGSPFVKEWEAQRGRTLEGIGFEPFWPLNTLRPYAGNEWSQTINGNSVTFKLTYGDFEMLFTGDHNEHSEEALLEHLRQTNREHLLDCDVLKVPHHGSKHASEAFFRAGTRGPVISVASMGNQGFKSKFINNNRSAWQHPSTEVIQWLGGAHRFYSTFIHEQRFRYEDLDTEAKRQSMIEKSHILIETDGQWFRVVEVDAIQGDPRQPPSVQATARGDGTRWIRARDN